MHTKIIVTLGPSTRTQKDLEKIKDKGVDFVRINMSHSSIDDLEYFIALAKKVDIPFIIDTEGSQVRTGNLEKTKVIFGEGDEIKIYNDFIDGNEKNICLKPKHVIDQLEEGDILHVDFGKDIGLRKSSAQITELYNLEELVGRLVVGVVNFPKKQIGPLMSECLVTGFHNDQGHVVLCVPDKELPLGARLL